MSNDKSETPKVKPSRVSVPPNWFLELSFKQIGGHVFCSVQIPGKSEKPLCHGVVFNAIGTLNELTDAIKESQEFGQ